MRRAGLSDRVEIKLQDYRDETGTYDGIASIEMFEAVGEKYWPVYFRTLRDRLKPGANATLQIITVEDRRWEVYKRGVDFIQKFIFPGGMLPCPRVLRAEVETGGLDGGPVGRVRAELQPDAAALARDLQRPLGRNSVARIRRSFPKNVELLPDILRGHVRKRKLRRDPDHGDKACLNAHRPEAHRRPPVRRACVLRVRPHQAASAGRARSSGSSRW
jgi:hypothetical protein